MPRLSIVWDRVAGGDRIGTTSENFIAIWGEEDGSAHYTVSCPPEWQPLADEIEALLKKHLPDPGVLGLPHMPEPEWYES